MPLALLVHLGLQCSVTRLCLASDQVHVLLVLCSDGRRAVSAVTGDGEFGCQAGVGGDKNLELMGQLGYRSVPRLNFLPELEGRRRCSDSSECSTVPHTHGPLKEYFEHLFRFYFYSVPLNASCDDSSQLALRGSISKKNVTKNLIKYLA